MKQIAIAFSVFAGLLISRSIHAGDDQPGLKAMVQGSSDIIVAEVLETQPRKAIEGARDNARLKVVRTLKGPLQPGNEVVAYYHLLWVDDNMGDLEKPKLKKGKRYTIFLDKGNIGYTVTEQWLGILPENSSLDRDVALAMNHIGALGANVDRYNKGVMPSFWRIEIVPAGKVTRTLRDATLPVTITNHSPHVITTELAHEWHGGQMPVTKFYGMTKQPKDKEQVRHFERVYLAGETDKATETTRIPPGKSITVTVRMDYNGTGTQSVQQPLSYPWEPSHVRFLLVFKPAGSTSEYYAAGTAKLVEFEDKRWKDK